MLKLLKTQVLLDQFKNILLFKFHKTDLILNINPFIDHWLHQYKLQFYKTNMPQYELPCGYFSAQDMHYLSKKEIWYTELLKYQALIWYNLPKETVIIVNPLTDRILHRSEEDNQFEHNFPHFSSGRKKTKFLKFCSLLLLLLLQLSSLDPTSNFCLCYWLWICVSMPYLPSVTASIIIYSHENH